ncbi:MAG: hypothetical protein RSE17_01460 [Bacilli bacterium]
MDNLLDECIDDQLEKKFGDILCLTTGFNITKHFCINDELHSIICLKLTELLFLNCEVNINKTKMILHIVLYNYIFSIIYEDEFLKKIKFEELVENSSTEKLIDTISDYQYLQDYLVQNYFDILDESDVRELITDNFNLCECIKYFDDWSIFFENKWVLLTEKLCYILYELNNICIMSEPFNEADLFYDFLVDNNDTFNVASEEFGSFKNYFVYKSILVQLLYLNTYLFLIVEKNNRKLSIEEDTLLTFVELSITNNETTTLPKTKVKVLQMVHCFLNVKFDKEKYSNKSPLENKETIKLARKKVNSLVLLDIMS